MLIAHSCAHGMKTEAYLTYPQDYERFRLTRPYGTFRSNFDCFPRDLFNNHIKQPLANAMAIKFKHAILEHNFDQSKSKVQNLIPLESQQDITFRYHDGMYTLAPDIEQNYAMWDEALINKKTVITTRSFQNPDKWVQVLCNPKKPELSIYSTQLSVYFLVEQFRNNNKNTFSIIAENEDPEKWSFSSDLAITHHVMSCDGKWLALAIQKENSSSVLNLFDLDYLKLKFSFPLEDPITTVCAAHTSTLFAVCNKNGNVTLIKENRMGKEIHITTDEPVIDALFSPNDERLIIYGKKKFIFLNTKDIWQTSSTMIEPEPIGVEIITMNHPIRKIFFTPDSRLIIVANTNGRLGFCDGFTGQPLPQYKTPWQQVQLDNQALLILCSLKNKLVFSLDPASHNKPLSSLIVRKLSGKFKPLMQYRFYQNNPRAMGLTEDERSIVFIHSDNTASRLQLYTDDDMSDANFIEQKADLYHLCVLSHMLKPKLRNIDMIRHYIKSHSNNTSLSSMSPNIANS